MVVFFSSLILSILRRNTNMLAETISSYCLLYSFSKNSSSSCFRTFLFLFFDVQAFAEKFIILYRIDLGFLMFYRFAFSNFLFSWSIDTKDFITRGLFAVSNATLFKPSIVFCTFEKRGNAVLMIITIVIINNGNET